MRTATSAVAKPLTAGEEASKQDLKIAEMRSRTATTTVVASEEYGGLTDGI